MLCVLCGKRGEWEGFEGFCPDCQNLIYRNNDRLEYQKILRDVLNIRNLPGSIRARIEEALQHAAPFDEDKEY